jgi:hypothetical protein
MLFQQHTLFTPSLNLSVLRTLQFFKIKMLGMTLQMQLNAPLSVIQQLCSVMLEMALLVLLLLLNVSTVCVQKCKAINRYVATLRVIPALLEQQAVMLLQDAVG